MHPCIRQTLIGLTVFFVTATATGIMLHHHDTPFPLPVCKICGVKNAFAGPLKSTAVDGAMTLNRDVRQDLFAPPILPPRANAAVSPRPTAFVRTCPNRAPPSLFPV